MNQPSRIDQAIAPAGLVKSAAAHSLFIAPEGVYAIRTGPGWRMQVRGRHRNERLVDDVRRVEDALDPSNLIGELAARNGSLFVPAASLSDVVLSRRLDQLPDLRFGDGKRSYRYQFDAGRSDEVEAFGAALLLLSASELTDEIKEGDDSGGRQLLSFEGEQIKTVALPSPCWGATPHIALLGGRIFVHYLAPTGVNNAEKFVVHRASYDEHCDIVYGRTELLGLCQRLVQDAWDMSAQLLANSTAPTLIEAQHSSALRELEHALALSIARRKSAELDLGRGGSAEQQDRQERINRHEIEQMSFAWALRLATS